MSTAIASSISFTAAPSTALDAEEEVFTPATVTVDPTELVEEPDAQESSHSEASSASSASSSSSSSSTFPWESESPTPTAPPATTTPAPTPPATTAAPTTVVVSTSSGSGSSRTVMSVSFVLAAVLLVLCVAYFVRRRRQQTRSVQSKFQLQDPTLGTPTISIELPPPPPSALNQSSSSAHLQRLSVRSGGDSMFNTAAAVVSPHTVANQHQGSGGAPFNPAQSTTYRLVDKSPSRHPPQPRFGASTSYVTLNENLDSRLSDDTAAPTSTAISIDDSSRDTTMSSTSTINGLHDSLCDDLFQFGDGLGRERAASRARSRSRSRGMSTGSGTSRSRKPSVVREDYESKPVAPPPLQSNKTLSIRRAPPPPPPSQHTAVILEDPDDVGLDTSMRIHRQRASEDNSFIPTSPNSVAASTSSSQGSTTSCFQSSHNSLVFDPPTDAKIQRLSDVSSISSDSSTQRPGSLIELKQVVEVENPDGKAKEIEI